MCYTAVFVALWLASFFYVSSVWNRSSRRGMGALILRELRD